MMITKKLLWLTSIAAIVLTSLTISSCKKKFDEPPMFEEPNVTVNMTIKELKALHTVSGKFDTVKVDKVISGIVVGDDKTGNFYKSLIIQDETGGIAIRMNQTNLYTSYPRGRRVYVKVNGLVLGDYNRLQQIGAGVNNSDPSQPELASLEPNQFDKYILKGSFGNNVTPKVVSSTALLGTTLQDTLQNTLIQLNNFQFAIADTNKTYAPYQVTQNYTIANCSGSSIVLRNSGYATFQPVPIPNGGGSIIGVYSVFGSTKQLMIRDTSDVQFTGARCGTGGPSPTLNIVTIASLRALYTGTSVTLPANTGIEGTIVSNRSNEAAGNYRIQDASGAGIQLRFTTSGNGNYNLNDKVRADVSSLMVESFNGDLQIQNVASASVTGTGAVTPRVTTVAQINANANAWASTVVTINTASIATGSSNATGINYTFTDASGGIASFIRTTLGYTPPASATSITGYVSLFNGTPQLTLRQSADVVSGSGPVTPPPTGTGTTEDFETGTKASYAAGTATLTTGVWSFSDAGTFGDASDIKTGTKSARLRGSNTTEGFIKTDFTVTGLKTVKFKFAGTNFNEGTDAGQEISAELRYSTNNGSTWTTMTKKIGVTGTFTTAQFDINAAATANVMIMIVNKSFLRSTNNQLRINVDDVEFIK